VSNVRSGRPWTSVRYQAYGLAKIWEGTARLPSETELWRQYESTRYTFFWDLWGTARGEGTSYTHLVKCCAHLRSSVTSSVGYLVEQRVASVRRASRGPLPQLVRTCDLTDVSMLNCLYSNREEFAYFMNWEIGEEYITNANFTKFEHLPASQWGAFETEDEAQWNDEDLEYGLW
jgi:hypothetical protein